MLYKLLGMIVWRVGKRVLQRKYGSTAGVAFVLRSRSAD